MLRRPKTYIKNLCINVSSGDIIFNSSIKINDLILHQSSGNIKSDYEIRGEKVDIKGTSGDVNLNSIICTNYKIKETSGNIKIKEISGKGLAKVTSGDLNISYKKFQGDSSVDSSSGNLKLRFLSGFDGKIDVTTNSGNLNSNLGLSDNKDKEHIEYKMGNSNKVLRIRTNSGDIKLIK